MNIRYAFEHKRMPMYCARNRDMLLDLVKSGKLEKILEFLYGQAAQMIGQEPVKTKIKTITGKLKSGEYYFVVDRPAPTKPLECKWLVGVIGKKETRYFVCELAIANPEKVDPTKLTKEFIQTELDRKRSADEEKYYVLCEWRKDDAHINFGGVDGDSYEKVLERIEEIIQE